MMKLFSGIKNCLKGRLSTRANSIGKLDPSTEPSENEEMKAMFDGSASFQEQADELFGFGSYSLEKELGSGGFGTVYLCKLQGSNRRYAGKLYDVGFIKDASNMDSLNSEVKILKKLSHRNTISFVDLVFSRRGVLLVMELVEGRELNEIVRNKIGIVEPFARIMFVQLMEVVKYLHGQRIVHRDIKIDNVLVDNRGTLKLVDYGLSDLVPEARYKKAGLIVSGIQGTQCYYPPEIVRAIETEDDEAKFMGDKIDIWTAGVLLYTLVSGKHPFSEESVEELMHDISCANVDYDKVDFSPELEHLLRFMLKVEPSERASVEEILNHPWSLDSRFDHTKEKVFTSVTGRFEVQFVDGAPETIFSCPRNFPQFDRLRVLSQKEAVSCCELCAWRQESIIDADGAKDENSYSSVEDDWDSLSVECDEIATPQDEKLQRGTWRRKLLNGYLVLTFAVRDFRDLLKSRSVRLDLRQQDMEQLW